MSQKLAEEEDGVGWGEEETGTTAGEKCLEWRAAVIARWSSSVSVFVQIRRSSIWTTRHVRVQ